MFISQLLKARRVKGRKENLIKEKQIALAEFRKRQNEFKVTKRIKRVGDGCCRSLRKCFGYREGTKLHRLCYNVKHDGTIENFLFKSVLGFVGGFFLTYVFFMFFFLQLNFKLSTSTIMCSVFGSILTIGLAFSYKVRCIVFLVLPQFFSKRGRQALLAYAFILAITGPAKNTLNNMSILGESLACGQEQLKSVIKQIIEVIKVPFIAIKDAIKSVVKTVKQIVAKIKEILLSIKRVVISLVKVIKAGFDFMASIMNMCNHELGTPFQRCKRVFENAITDCNAKLGPLFNWLCNITYLVKHVCYIVKVVDFVCIVVDFVKDTVSAITTKVKQFIRHIRVMFYVRIRFHHSFKMEQNSSRTMSDITTGIVTELKQRTSGLIKLFDFMSTAASLFFIFMVFKVIYYRHKFLTNERFDNKFITKDFREIDLRRAQMGLETVLPLNHRERQLYIKPSAFRLVKQEKTQLSQSAMILLLSTLKLGIHMATDYSLYWIMTLIRFHGRFQSKVPKPNIPTLNIVGEGFLADLLRSVVNAFQPLGLNLEIDTVPCLPDPIPPDYDRYIQIATLMLLCWFLAIFEPYGLRFRHWVMCYYHPKRAKERSIWLYNNILRSRQSFLKFARRQLRRKVKGDTKISKITFMEFLRAKLHCKVFRFILGTKKVESCLLCGEAFREGDGNKPIRCQTPNCYGIYCKRCFKDLQNLCTICLDPVDYGDLSDLSEEKDSSEEESRAESKNRSKKSKKKKRRQNSSKDGDTTDSDSPGPFDNSTKQLLPKKKRSNHDSDYYSPTQSPYTSDYDYDYQNKKDITALALMPRDSFVDVERQHIGNYVSMQDLQKKRTEPEELSHPDFSSPDDSSLIAELARTASLEHMNYPLQNTAMSKLSLDLSFRSSKAELTATPNTSSPFSANSSSSISEFRTNDRHFYLDPRKANSKISTESVELEGSSKTTFILTPRSRMDDSTTINTSDGIATETSFITELTHPDVPKLNLAFTDQPGDVQCTASTNEKCAKLSCNCRFFKDKVRYSTVTETSDQRYDDNISSSLISSLNEIPKTIPKEAYADSGTQPRSLSTQIEHIKVIKPPPRRPKWSILSYTESDFSPSNDGLHHPTVMIEDESSLISESVSSVPYFSERVEEMGKNRYRGGEYKKRIKDYYRNLETRELRQTAVPKKPTLAKKIAKMFKRKKATFT